MVKKTKGFSIVEIAVVLVVIGITAIISINAAQMINSAFISREAKGVTALFKQEMINTVRQLNYLPGEDEIQFIMDSLPISIDTKLEYYPKPGLHNNLCGFRYTYASSGQEHVFENISGKAKPYAFAVSYFYKDMDKPIYTDVMDFRELLNELDCRVTNTPVILTDRLPALYREDAYNQRLQFLPASGQNGLYLCIALSSKTDTDTNKLEYTFKYGESASGTSSPIKAHLNRAVSPCENPDNYVWIDSDDYYLSTNILSLWPNDGLSVFNVTVYAMDSSKQTKSQRSYRVNVYPSLKW